tara:strand:- start:6445 stop:7368 length:924 start_codon:yes stop_codon:yes gene_type:complete
MTNEQPDPKVAVKAAMIGAAPERKDELAELWARYDPAVELAQKAGKITLNANKDRIQIDPRTMDVFWLIGFSGWRAIESYSPHVILSAATNQKLSDLFDCDDELDEIERSYRERLAAAQALIKADDTESIAWPDDIPRPIDDRNAVSDPQYQTAFDLTTLAVAYTLFHEFRHVMLDVDGERHDDLREEELSCDVWAREFMTAKLDAYGERHSHSYQEVLRKRSMGLVLASLILHEITPFYEHGGSYAYFSVGDRLRAILSSTNLADNDHFWRFAASVLVGIYRRKRMPIDTEPMSAKLLADHLLSGL